MICFLINLSIHMAIYVPSRGGLSMPIRARFYRLVPNRARLYYVSAHQGQVVLCQCPSGPGISAHQGQVSVPIRARFYRSVPNRARLYYVSAHQGQVVLCQCPSGPDYRSVPSRARYQCPAGPTWLVW